jgi:hypothetical protein
VAGAAGAAGGCPHETGADRMEFLAVSGSFTGYPVKLLDQNENTF